jgi:hypothetical protein
MPALKFSPAVAQTLKATTSAPLHSECPTGVCVGGDRQTAGSSARLTLPSLSLPSAHSVTTTWLPSCAPSRAKCGFVTQGLHPAVPSASVFKSLQTSQLTSGRPSPATIHSFVTLAPPPPALWHENIIA